MVVVVIFVRNFLLFVVITSSIVKKGNALCHSVGTLNLRVVKECRPYIRQWLVEGCVHNKFQPHRGSAGFLNSNIAFLVKVLRINGTTSGRTCSNDNKFE